MTRLKFSLIIFVAIYLAVAFVSWNLAWPADASNGQRAVYVISCGWLAFVGWWTDSL